jgi:DNA-binding GntR family transcriptional regulator
MFVTDVSITDLQKIFEARMVLEPFCVQLAVQRATAEQLAEMTNVVHEMDRMSDGDSRALMAIDERFHGLLYEAADNEFVADPLRRLHALSFRLWHLVLDRLGGVRHSMEQHREIAEALNERDGARAAELIQRHVSDFQREVKSVL